MIPKYDLLNYRHNQYSKFGEVVAWANELMTNEQIDLCSELIREKHLVADDIYNYFIVIKLENVCY